MTSSCNAEKHLTTCSNSTWCPRYKKGLHNHPIQQTSPLAHVSHTSLRKPAVGAGAKQQLLLLSHRRPTSMSDARAARPDSAWHKRNDRLQRRQACCQSDASPRSLHQASRGLVLTVVASPTLSNNPSQHSAHNPTLAQLGAPNSCPTLAQLEKGVPSNCPELVSRDTGILGVEIAPRFHRLYFLFPPSRHDTSRLNTATLKLTQRRRSLYLCPPPPTSPSSHLRQQHEVCRCSLFRGWMCRGIGVHNRPSYRGQ